MRRSYVVSLISTVVLTAVAVFGALAAGWSPVLGLDLQGGVAVVLEPTEPADDETLDQAIEIIRNRVDAIGVAEPDITRQGQSIVVQLPGVNDAQRALELVGQTAELRFRPVVGSFPVDDEEARASAAQLLELLNTPLDETPDPATPTTAALPAPSLEELLTDPDMEDADSAVALPSLDGSLVFVLGPTDATGEIISTAGATFRAEWQVNVTFTDEGSDVWDAVANVNFGRQLGIALDGVVYSAPSINARDFDGQAVISGQFTEDEAKDLALVLRFGALPVELEPQTVQAVSATLGQDALRAGLIAGIVGLVLVALYMVFFYRLLGIVAMLSLMVSGGMLWFIISWLGEWQGLALTLAGATGIVLSIGVAVDSNIVYYERIKEEVRRGRAVRSAADGSFASAFSTIVKADAASIIGAVILYVLTVGAVRGFALYLGIATVLDLIVSYVFMHPLVVLLTRKFAAENPERLGVTGEVAS